MASRAFCGLGKPRGGGLDAPAPSRPASSSFLSVGRLDSAKALSTYVTELLTYPNFKAGLTDAAYHDRCLQVWAEMKL